MIQYNMLEAKNNLSKICHMVKNGQEDYVLIASNGTPIAKVIPVESTKRKFGCYKNKFKKLSDVDWFNDDITNLFYGDDK